MEKRLIVIDSNALVHRGYHALPKLTTKNGELINAVYGFLLVFLKTIKEFNPDYIAACFDLPRPTFRHKRFADYKATRPKAPDDLYEQIPKVKEILSAFSVPIFEKEGFEADDLIGTIVKKITDESVEKIILSGDLDTLQTVDKNTKVYTLRKGVRDTILYDQQKVLERYQIPPVLLPDFKALKGDPSDNIPGVPGIGEKTAIELVKRFGSLENIYKEIEANSEEVKKLKPKLKALLENSKDQAFFSKMLSQIRYDVPIEFSLEGCQWKNYERAKAIEVLRKFEFYSLIDRLPQASEKNTRKLF
jgi:DNA polymerase-1